MYPARPATTQAEPAHGELSLASPRRPGAGAQPPAAGGGAKRGRIAGPGGSCADGFRASPAARALRSLLAVLHRQIPQPCAALILRGWGWGWGRGGPAASHCTAPLHASAARGGERFQQPPGGAGGQGRPSSLPREAAPPLRGSSSNRGAESPGGCLSNQGAESLPLAAVEVVRPTSGTVAACGCRDLDRAYWVLLAASSAGVSQRGCGRGLKPLEAESHLPLGGCSCL